MTANPNLNPNPTGGPLITRTAVRMGEMFRNRPVPSADQATVFLDRNGGYHHYTEQLPLGGVPGLRTQFLVDTSVFNHQLQLPLPSREQAFFFQAKVVVSWRVTDPVEAVRTNLVNAGPILRPHVERVLRDISVTFSIEDGTSAERAMAAAFDDARRKRTLPQGVSVLACDVALTLDAATIAYITKRTEDTRAHTIKAEGLRLAGVEQTAEQRMERMRAEHELALRRMAEEHELRLEQQRMEFYGDAIARDPNNALGIMLSRSPDRAHEVVAMLMKQHQVERDEARKVLETMLDNGLVTRSDVSGVIGRSTAVLTGGVADAPVKVGLDPASVPLPSGDPLEQPLTAEVVVPDPFSAKPLFEPSDFEDEDEDDL
ncbi:hypothetical protein ACFYOT_15775 [Saccharothrix saharensis]|uniref:hypothetical protein n=1 Tax=Saccharothrix saharensis TaxID=571190 RepID=UPI0036A08748